MGRVEPSADERLARRFLARHPEAERYAGFADFGFYRMTVERAHYVGGFAKAVWIKAGTCFPRPRRRRRSPCWKTASSNT